MDRRLGWTNSPFSIVAISFFFTSNDYLTQETIGDARANICRVRNAIVALR